jgi:hypothetical protein
MHSWKFTDEEGFLCVAEYDSFLDFFTVWKVGKELRLFSYHPDEVEYLLDKGIWKRVS